MGMYIHDTLRRKEGGERGGYEELIYTFFPLCFILTKIYIQICIRHCTMYIMCERSNVISCSYTTNFSLDILYLWLSIYVSLSMVYENVVNNFIFHYTFSGIRRKFIKGYDDFINKERKKERIKLSAEYKG